MKKNILFSVIIPIYNSEKYILETINSILNQDYPFFELILVDDGSSDDSFLIIEEYVKNDIRIKYFKKNNSGAAETRNYGLKYATGDYIFFLDSDDLIEKDTFSFLAKHIENKKFDIYVFGYDNFDDARNNITKYFPNLDKNEYFDDEIKNELIPKMIVNIKDEKDCNVHFNRMMIISKSLIKKINWFFVSERIYLSEDVVSLLDLFYYSKSVKIIDRIFYHYRINSNSLSHNYDEKFNKKNNNMLKILLDNCMNKYEGKYIERIIYLFFSYTIVNIKSIAHSSLTFKKKLEKIDNIVNNDKLQELINKYIFLNNFKRKIFLKLIKKKRKLLILLVSLVK